MNPVFVFFLISAGSAVLVNVTIDDTLGDSETGAQMTYLPSGAWDYGPTCQTCPATPLINPSQAFDGTWHDSTSDTTTGDTTGTGLRTVSAPFHGTAVYVYCILPNNGTSTQSNSDMSFIIDDYLAGNFVHYATGGTVTYNALVFENTSLPEGNHTLTIQNGSVGGSKSLMLLDYIVYSYEKQAPTSTNSIQSNPTSTGNSAIDAARKSSIAGIVVGSVFAGITGIGLGLLGILWYRQRSSIDSVSSSEEGSPAKRWREFLPAFLRHWWSSEASSPRQFSFSPNLLVRPMIQRSLPMPSHAIEPPIITIQPLPGRAPSPQPLDPCQETCATPRTSAARHLAQALVPLSISEWRRRTLREADPVAPRFPATDAEFSSYYEDESTVPAPRLVTTSPGGARRFTVMNR